MISVTTGSPVASFAFSSSFKLMSAEYIMAGGNDQVILCERGIRTYETATRNTLDLSCIPVLREKTHHVRKFIRRQRLRTVAQRVFRVIVYLNHQAVRTCNAQHAGFVLHTSAARKDASADSG